MSNSIAKKPSPEEVLEMLYHREIGFGLDLEKGEYWSFKSSLRALGFLATEAEIKMYRDHFITYGYGKFDGSDDPMFQISEHGEAMARKSIMRRKPIYSIERLQTYDWSFWGGLAAIISALFSLLSAFFAYKAIP